MIRRSFISWSSKAFAGLSIIGIESIFNLSNCNLTNQEEKILQDLRAQIRKNLEKEELGISIANRLTNPTAIISHLDLNSDSCFEYICENNVRVKIYQDVCGPKIYIEG